MSSADTLPRRSVPRRQSSPCLIASANSHAASAGRARSNERRSRRTSAGASADPSAQSEARRDCAAGIETAATAANASKSAAGMAALQPSPATKRGVAPTRTSAATAPGWASARSTARVAPSDHAQMPKGGASPARTAAARRSITALASRQATASARIAGGSAARSSSNTDGPKPQPGTSSQSSVCARTGSSMPRIDLMHGRAETVDLLQRMCGRQRDAQAGAARRHRRGPDRRHQQSVLGQRRRQRNRL